MQLIKPRARPINTRWGQSDGWNVVITTYRVHGLGYAYEARKLDDALRGWHAGVNKNMTAPRHAC